MLRTWDECHNDFFDPPRKAAYRKMGLRRGGMAKRPAFLPEGICRTAESDILSGILFYQAYPKNIIQYFFHNVKWYCIF